MVVSNNSIPVVISTITTPVTIIDNDTLTISISNDTVAEPAAGFTPHAINFVADKAVEGTFRMDAAVAAGGGLAIGGLVGAVIDGDGTTGGRQQDYTGPGGTNASSTNLGTPGDIVWTNTVAGASGSVTLPVEINADTLIEADESINVHYTNTTHSGVNTSWTAPFGTGPGSLSDEVLINDGDVAKLDVTGATVTEGQTANVQVQLDTSSMNGGVNHTLQQDLSFLLASTDGSGIGGAFSTPMAGIQPAAQGADYTNTPPTVTFAAGAGNGATATGGFATNDEMIIEATETFTVNASPFPGSPTTLNFSGSIPSANAANTVSYTHLTLPTICSV